ncbi:MAG TPA: hypothetical protein VFK31_03870 [Rhodanobacteraceae bacterium]|nr:hypothetical protein [Rhodanobacteraceae bacterium]
MKHTTTPEIMLALRSPDAGWLSVLACVIDEASHDPRFNQRQRELAMQLLQDGQLSAGLAEAARQRANCFEAELADDFDFAESPAAARPKLTLVGTHAG